MQKKNREAADNWFVGRTSKTNNGRDTRLTSQDKGSFTYATPKGKRIRIETLSNGMFRPYYLDGGAPLVLGSFTSFDDAERAVVKHIQRKQRFRHQPGVYPDKYKGTSPWWN